MDDNYFNGFGSPPFGADGTDGQSDENAQPVNFTDVNTDNGDPPYTGNFSDKEQYGGAADERQANGTYYTGGENPTVGYAPYPNMNSGKKKRAKKPPTRKTLAAFGIITLVLCLVMSAVSGAISSFVTVQVLENAKNPTGTTTQHEDELISVPTDASAEIPANSIEPTDHPAEAPTEGVTK